MISLSDHLLMEHEGKVESPIAKKTRGKNWTPEEIETLNSLRAKGLTYRQIGEFLPGRNHVNIENKWWHLNRKGKIK